MAAPSRTLLEICGACGRRCRLQPEPTQPGGLCPSFRGSCRPASALDAPHLNSHLPSDGALLVLQNWPVSARGTYAHMDVNESLGESIHMLFAGPRTRLARAPR